MRFVTCLDYKKLVEMIEVSRLDNNDLFVIPSSQVNQLTSMLENLNGDSSSINVGLYIPSSYGGLSEIWSKVSRVLPIKSGDAIFQFNLNGDECLYFELNNFLSGIYNSNSHLESLVEFSSDDICLVVCDSISIKSFDCAYIVDSKWSSNPLDSSLSGSLVSSLIELNSSEVWRS